MRVCDAGGANSAIAAGGTPSLAATRRMVGISDRPSSSQEVALDALFDACVRNGDHRHTILHTMQPRRPEPGIELLSCGLKAERGLHIVPDSHQPIFRLIWCRLAHHF